MAEEGRPRTVFTRLNTPQAAARALRQVKRSTWLINIGTHRKPYDDDEYETYKESLYQAIQRMFDNEIEPHRMRFYYPVRKVGNGWIEFTDQRDTLEIGNEDVDVVVERGTITGRIDAHLLLTVEHTGPLIRFDHKEFARMLQTELEFENAFMQGDTTGVYTRKEPGYQHENIQWPTNGVPYVSFRLISNFNNFQTIAYITKQHQGVQIYDNEFNALNNLVGGVRDRVRTRGSRNQLA